jgi:hypothetical protein
MLFLNGTVRRAGAKSLPGQHQGLLQGGTKIMGWLLGKVFFMAVGGVSQL